MEKEDTYERCTWMLRMIKPSRSVCAMVVFVNDNYVDFDESCSGRLDNSQLV